MSLLGSFGAPLHPVPSLWQGKYMVIAAADSPLLHAVCSLIGFILRMASWNCLLHETLAGSRHADGAGEAEDSPSLVLGHGAGMGTSGLSWHCRSEGLQEGLSLG